MNLLRNPGLKVLALILAVALWYGVSLRRSTREGSWSLEVPVQVEVPADDIVTRQSMERVVVSGRGTMPAPGTVAFRLRLDHPREGMQTLQLSPQGLSEPQGTEFLALAPSAVDVTVDRRGRKEVPIEIPSSLASQDLSIQLYPKKAVLSGPKKVLAGIRSLQIQPVTLLGQYPQISITRSIAPHPLVTVVAPQEVTVVVQRNAP